MVLLLISANCRFRTGLSTLISPFYMSLSNILVRSITHRSREDVLSRSIPVASLKVSLIVANTITVERRAFTTGFQAVLED